MLNLGMDSFISLEENPVYKTLVKAGDQVFPIVGRAFLSENLRFDP